MSQGQTEPKAPKVFGVMAEFSSAGQLMHAVKAIRNRGFTRVEGYSPFPVHGLDIALGHPGSKVPWIVLMGSVIGAGSGL